MAGGDIGLDYSIAMTESLDNDLQNFLLNDKTEEEICFASWKPSVGASRYSILLHGAMYPKEDDRESHGTVSAFPSYVDRCKELARENDSGLAMIHTHPSGLSHQDVSHDDQYYEQDVLAREVFGITGLPFVGITLAGDGTWSGRTYPKPFKIRWCSEIRVVGKNLKINFHPEFYPRCAPTKKQIRTTSVWGDSKQNDIMRLRVGIIGVGSIGSAVGEILARMGSKKILLMDYDRIKIHNLDRMVGIDENHIGKFKKDVVQKNLCRSATSEGFDCTTSDNSIVEEAGYEEALDCDVIFCCVDRPWPRQVLNHIAYSNLIPVIDGGVGFDVRKGKLVHGMYRAQTIGPERACLDCLGALNIGEVQMDRDGMFDDPAYIEKHEQETGKNTRQNIMPFSFGLAGLESIQFVELITNLANTGNLGQQAYDYRTGEILPKLGTCRENCMYQQLVAKGDTEKPVLGIDKSKSREAGKRNSPLRQTIQSLIKFFMRKNHHGQHNGKPCM